MSKNSKTALLIKHAREIANLTQVEAAAITGYSVSALQKFENGRRVPPDRAIKPLLEKLVNAQKKGVR
jgi:DNA-binding transcriptional regulator YiaG